MDAARAPLIPASRDGGARMVTWRSVLLGVGGVVFVCGLTPYNDYALANTYFVGNYLPVGLILYFFLLVLLLNPILKHLSPRHMLGGGELAVALGMTLVSCAIPSAGLMRYLPSGLVGLHHQAGVNADYLDLLTRLDLPDWLFPTFASDDLLDRARDPVVTDFIGRTPGVDEGFTSRIAAVPWAAWARPAAAWGVLVGAVWGAVLCMSVLVRRQWVENERLPFPLASVYVSLIEPPAPGQAFNALFRSRVFWVAFGGVFLIHLINGLNSYFPRYAPTIPISYNLSGILSDGLWQHAEFRFKYSVVYFSVVGIAYFLQTKLAFSLWFFYVLRQFIAMAYGARGAELSGASLSDQVFGALLAFAAMVIWVGRQEWGKVIRQMFGRPSSGAESNGDYLPARVAGWGFVLCNLVAAGWLIAAGMTAVGAIVLVAMMMTTFLVMARVVAETGLIFATVGVWFLRPWIVAIQAGPAPLLTTPRTFFFTQWMTALTVPGLRETLSVYSTHALRVHDEVAAGSPRARGPAFVFLLTLSLVLGYFVAGASTLYVEYNHASTLGANPQSPINAPAVIGTPESMLSLTRNYQEPFAAYRDRHSALGHTAVGAGITGVLSFLRLRFAWWPLHPIGYLLWSSWPMAAVWFSIFVGWLAKLLLVRFGGAGVFRAARPLFIGLILGEVAAACLWLVVSLVLGAAGVEFHPINLLPG